MAPPLIELIVPVFNEGAVIEAHLREILHRAAPPPKDADPKDAAPTDAAPNDAAPKDAAPKDHAPYQLRLLVIDDGSQDDTAAALERFCAGEPRARYLSLTRNFGKEAAISAGLDQARSDAAAVVLLDSDLQHPPEMIPAMVESWRAGYRVVEAVKHARGQESLSSRCFALLFYRLFHALANLDLRGQSDFKLLDKIVLERYRQLHERERFFRGLIQWMAYPTAQLTFEVPPRAGGESRWNRLKLLRYALRNITAFSALPLQFISGCGLVSLLVGLVFGVIALYQKIRGEALDGFTTVILLMIFFSGTLMLSLGIIGHYLARIYEEIKARPLYLIKPRPSPPEKDRNT
ncbi:MAG: glycosyltransferase family 2 protein [Azovibrio sp.]|uniref:glycosyltransferase family 2 protein n=1 Tax=Azovibrio sp. TaxID=1872673 RepID=UPI003C78AB5B